MTKMHKILSALLLVLVMLMVTACSGNGDTLKQPDSVDSGSNVTTDSEAQGNGTEAATDDVQEETQAPAGDAVTIAETVLYDANGVKVTANGYEDGWMGPEIKLLVENNSDKNILITSDSVSVNGYMISLASLYEEVAAGKKANTALTLSTSQLEQSGITTIAQLQFYLQLQDPESWDTIATSDLLTLDTSAAGYEQSVDTSGDLVYEGNDLKVICKGLKQDLIWDGTVVFYMENNSDKNVSIYAENVSVNGFMVDASLWCELRNGTKCVDGMSMLDLSELNIDSIDKIETIEFTLRATDAETWDEIVTTDAITLTFN